MIAFPFTFGWNLISSDPLFIAAASMKRMDELVCTLPCNISQKVYEQNKQAIEFKANNQISLLQANGEITIGGWQNTYALYGLAELIARELPIPSYVSDSLLDSMIIQIGFNQDSHANNARGVLHKVQLLKENMPYLNATTTFLYNVDSHIQSKLKTKLLPQKC